MFWNFLVTVLATFSKTWAIFFNLLVTLVGGEGIVAFDVEFTIYFVVGTRQSKKLITYRPW